MNWETILTLRWHRFDNDSLSSLSSCFNFRWLLLKRSSALCFLFANTSGPPLWRLNSQAMLEKKFYITSTPKKEKNKVVKATTETYCTNISHMKECHNLNKHSYGFWTGWWELALPTYCSSCQQYSRTSRNWHSSPDTNTKARASTNQRPTSNSSQKSVQNNTSITGTTLHFKILQAPTL